MDDYNLNVLSEAKNEYSSRLLNILSPLIIQGIKSIFNEALDLCNENEEDDKYLMTFQNFLSRVPRWNSTIIKEEKKRIITESKCNYLEDLLTCVHITQVKILTSIRVSSQQKKIDIDIPSLDDFIHNVYINFARKLYSNIYLFEKDILPLDYQKNMRECEILCRESILIVIRESMPIENILRAYMDETVHEEILEETLEKEVTEGEAEDMLEEAKKNLELKSEDGKKITKVDETDDNEIVVEKPNLKSNAESSEENTINDVASKEEKEAKEAKEAKEKEVKEAEKTKIAEATIKELEEEVKQNIKEEAEKQIEKDIKETEKLFDNDKKNTSNDKDISNDKKNTLISFNDNDDVLDMGTNEKSTIHAPKTDERLEEISRIANQKRKEEEEDDDDFDDFDDGPLNISDENISLDITDLQDLSQDAKINNSPILEGVEVLA
jgi:hypothetical protein